MRFRIATLFTLIFALIFPTTLFAANPKAGATCSKAGLTQTYAGKKFTCIKSGKKLVWDKGVLINTSPIPKSSPTTSTVQDSSSNIVDWSKTFSTDNGFKYLFNNPCQKEENIAPQWRELQDAYFKYSNCIWPINVAKYLMGKERPKTSEDFKNTLLVNDCKISEPENSRSLRGFYNYWPTDRQKWVRDHLVLGKNTNIQIIPIQTLDSAVPRYTPEQDYGRFTNFLIDWVEHSADNGANIKVTFPKNYIKFNGKIADYNIFHEAGENSAGHIKFNKDLIAQVDSYIDFTGVNLAIIVTPSGTDMSLYQQGTIGELITNEGKIPVSTTEFAYTFENFGSVKFKNLMLPYWWLHELLHSIAFDDHYGDSLMNINSDFGMGWWSLMTPGGGDLTAWEKWIMELISDQQVNCLTPNSTNITWLRSEEHTSELQSH